jgi:hypothetical protein
VVCASAGVETGGAFCGRAFCAKAARRRQLSIHKILGVGIGGLNLYITFVINIHDKWLDIVLHNLASQLL